MKTKIQKSFSPFKRILPGFLWRPLRAVTTALLTPVLFSKWSGHFKSSLREKAVSAAGDPLPWYTYPCIEFLAHRDMRDKAILEFGGGQSTFWWAARARRVVTIESDRGWHDQLKRNLPSNVELHHVPADQKENFLNEVKELLKAQPVSSFDVIIIDADYREDLVDVAIGTLSNDGALICDDAESYGFYAKTCGRELNRIDFFGYAPGVVLPHCTSIFFAQYCFLLSPDVPIPDIGKCS